MSRKLIGGQLPSKPPKTTRAGPPSLLQLDPDIINRIESALRIGSRVEAAFALQGISYDALRQWVLKGKEDPLSEYGQLIGRVQRALAEYEFRDLAVLEAHAQGRPAQFEMEPARDSDGTVLKDHEGKVIMVVARTKDGEPIIRSPAIKSDWRAAVERLSRRLPQWWARQDQVIVDAIMTFDNKQPETKEAMTFEQKVMDAYRRAKEDV